MLFAQYYILSRQERVYIRPERHTFYKREEQRIHSGKNHPQKMPFKTTKKIKQAQTSGEEI